MKTMKTIKTYEILKEIDLDPSKMLGRRFKQVGGLENEEFGIGDIAIVTRYCGITSLGAEKYSKIRITINGFEEWEEVKEPVDFMTAIEALDQGESVYVLYDDVYVKYSAVGNQNKWGVGITTIDTEQILYGKWYIEY